MQVFRRKPDVAILLAVGYDLPVEVRNCTEDTSSAFRLFRRVTVIPVGWHYIGVRLGFQNVQAFVERNEFVPKSDFRELPQNRLAEGSRQWQGQIDYLAMSYSRLVQ